MKKKFLAVFAFIIIIAGTITQNVHAIVQPSTSEILSAAAVIIRKNEGKYTSVNADDNGALSIGCIQWHGNRALNLLRSIISANPSNALSILGQSLYDEINTTSSWSTRTLSNDEATVISQLCGTPEGIAAQDALLQNDISSYINHGKKIGISSASALVYFADVENQCGYGGVGRVVNAAISLANGAADEVTLEILHKAALADSAAGKYQARRCKAYNYAFLLGWDDGSEAGVQYEVWNPTTKLNVRTGPGLSYSCKDFSLYKDDITIIYEKTFADGYNWGRAPAGWICLDYCDFIRGEAPSAVIFDPNGGSLDSKPVSTLKADGVNCPRGENQLIVYTPAFGRSTATNVWGSECTVQADGSIAEIPYFGSADTVIPDGGFVLSAHNSAALNILIPSFSWGYYAHFGNDTKNIDIYSNKNSYLANTKTVTRGQTFGDLPVPVRDGYMFEGWFTKEGKYIDNSTTVGTNSSLTLYARWRDIVYGTVAFDPNGGTIDGTTVKTVNGINTARGENELIVYNKSGSTGTNIYGCEVVVDKNGVVVSLPSDHSAGNNTVPDGGFVISGHGTSCEWIYYNIGRDNYISFDENSMTLTVYNNKETFINLNRSVAEGSPIGTLPSVSRNYYSFLGWYTASGKAATEQTVVPPGGIVLYAKWEAIPSKVTFDTNGGSKIGLITSGAASVSNYIREENRLVLYTPEYGENTKTNIYGTEIVVDSNGVVIEKNVLGKGDSYIPRGGFVLSGHGTSREWLQDNINLGQYIKLDGLNFYVYDSYAGYISIQKTVIYGNAAGILPSPQRYGYSFGGWYTPSGTKITESSVIDFYGDFSLTARWIPLTVKLNYDTAGGTIADDKLCSAAVYGINSPREESTIVIYDRNTGLTTGTNAYGAEAAVDSSGKVIAVHPYGTGDTQIPENGYVISGHITMGYWIQDNIKVGNYVELDRSNMQISVYSSNNRPGFVSSATFDSKIEFLRSASRDGYSFCGWYTAPDGGTLVTADTVSVFTADTTLYAHWATVTYIISFNANGGIGVPAEITASYGAEITLPDSIPSYTCKTFAGWSTVLGGSADYLPGSKFTPASDVTLYAVWNDGHVYNENCTAVLTGINDTTCEYIYTCALCSYNGSFTVNHSDVSVLLDINAAKGQTGFYEMSAAVTSMPKLRYFSFKINYSSDLSAPSVVLSESIADITTVDIADGVITVSVKSEAAFTLGGKLLDINFNADKADGNCISVSEFTATTDNRLPAYTETTQSITPLDPSLVPVIPGDVNGDGTVNIKDIFYVKVFIKQQGDGTTLRPDVNADGVVNIKDIFEIKLIIKNHS